MTDEAVLLVQEHYNSVYGSQLGSIPEDGQTGWTTVNALTRALQLELGISPQVNSFGPGTYAAVRAIAPLGPVTASPITTLVQCALWCKGYWGGELDGDWGPVVEAAVSQFSVDAGVGARVTAPATLVRALFNMDAFTIPVGSGGTAEIQAAQRWLNGKRWTNPSYVLSPCDGAYSRNVQRALVYSIQYELGMADSTTTGSVGPATRSGIKALPTYGPGSTDSGTGKTWIRHLQSLMVFNGLSTPMDGIYGSSTALAISLFRTFTALPLANTTNGTVWLELLVSNGDTDRATTGFDTATKLTPATAASLYSSGYRVVGRYIKQTDDHLYAITPPEARVIRNAGLNLWLYYQSAGTSANYFTSAQGTADAERAFSRAAEMGYTNDATIHFAVDFDVLGDEIQTRLIPYFSAVAQVRFRWLDDMGTSFNVGIYAPRAVARAVYDAGLATHIVVSGMSSGFSANLGVRLPQYWSKNQIVEVNHSSGVAIDKVVVRNDAGNLLGSSVAPLKNEAHDCLQKFAVRIRNWSTSVGGVLLTELDLARLVGKGLAYEDYLTPTGSQTGSLEEALIFDSYTGAEVGMGSYIADITGPVPSAADAAYASPGGTLSHLGVTLAGYSFWPDWGGPQSVGVADLGGWALDLVQLWHRIEVEDAYDEITDFVIDHLGVGYQNGSFDFGDLKADTDAFVIADYVKNSGKTVEEAIAATMAMHGTWAGLARFLDRRFGSVANLKAAIAYLFANSTLWTNFPVDKWLDSRPEGAQLAEFSNAVATRIGDLAAS